MFIFGYFVEPAQISRLQCMVSFIVCVYLPAFLAIHLKSSAVEGPSVVLFTRDLLLAYKEVDLPAVFPLSRFFQQIGDLLEQGQIIFGNIVNIPIENSTNL